MLNMLKIVLVVFVAALLSSCGHRDVISSGEAGVGLLINRTACPAVATPVYTNEITMFDPPSSREASAIDVTAVITGIRSTCTGEGAMIDTVASFEVAGTRTNPRGARDVTLPYFATVLRAGSQIVSKEIGRVGLHFDDGAYRASTTGQANTSISATAARLPADVEEQLTRRRRPGDADAATDPLADPAVRTAVENATFELLIGFQLEADQLEYNVTR